MIYNISVFISTEASDEDIEELYGTLGTVIGHEISHAFDSTGSRFDADGNINNWWTDEDLAAFDARAAKVVEYFDGIVAFDDGTAIHGQLVQGESIVTYDLHEGDGMYIAPEDRILVW